MHNSYVHHSSLSPSPLSLLPSLTPYLSHNSLSLPLSRIWFVDKKLDLAFFLVMLFSTNTKKIEFQIKLQKPKKDYHT
jgi:hypothetical protein